MSEYICSAFHECPKRDTCEHAKPHSCGGGMVKVPMPCYDTGLLSVCKPIEDGTIAAEYNERCECCGHITRVKCRRDVHTGKPVGPNGPT